MRYKSKRMVKSAMDESGDSSNSPSTNFNPDDSILDKRDECTIHSGHFMVSCVHHDEELEAEDLEGLETTQEEPDKPEEKGYDFNTAEKDISSSYKFGHRSTHHMAIDSSLSKLFQCMTLAYCNGKLTSPKWKNFKGIKLKLKDKIRLNNIIWREWHMQYCGKRTCSKFNKERHGKDIQTRTPIICQFEPPISDKTHTKPEAVVLEGKYWKRKLESVTAEYKKWRLFFHQRSASQQKGSGPHEVRRRRHSTQALMRSEEELLARVGHKDIRQTSATTGMSFTDQLLTDDDFAMDLSDTFSDTLFSSLNQPFAFPFPNPKEISQLGNADFIQPGLIQLQPNLDEFMDTLEPLPAAIQEMLAMSQRNSHGVTFSAGPMDDNSSFGFGDILMDQQPSVSDMSALSGNFISSAPDTTGLVQSSTNMAATPVTAAQGSAAQAQMSGVQEDKTSQIINLVLNQQPTSVLQGVSAGNSQMPQQIQITNDQLQGSQGRIDLQQQTLQQILALNQNQLTNSGKVTIIQSPSTLATLLQELGQQQGGATPVVTSSMQRPILQSLVAQAPLSVIKTDGLHHVTHSMPDIQSSGVMHDSRRASTGSMGKKDGDFLVPQVPKNKLRNIIPAPSPPLVAQQHDVIPKSEVQANNTFLAQLLTTGFSGPNFPLKSESKPAVTCSFPTISPSPLMTTMATSFSSPSVTFATSLSSPSVAFNIGSGGKSSVSDFQKNLLLAAASQAVGCTQSSVLEASASVLGDKSQGSTSCPSSPAYQMVSSPGGYTPINSPGSDSGSRSRHASNDSTESYGGESQSSIKPFRPKNEAERAQYKEHRRASHISAEQKRRCNIKTGFDLLHQLVPSLSQNPNAKISKAATLQKGAEYCKKLKQEKKLMHDEAEVLRQEIESLNSAISVCQSQLPATGVPVTRQRADHMRNMFDDYVKSRTLQNWKFWIFSIIIRPLFDSYNNMVSTASMDELCRSVLAWLEQHCSLVALRPAVLNSLRHLSTSTSILSDPSKVPEQATQAVIQQRQHHNSGNSSS